MGDKSFLKSLGLAGDKRLRFHIRTQKGKIIRFSVQLELLIENRWKPVVRYDNAHDFPHRDVLDTRGNVVEKKLLNLGTLHEIIEYAEQDLADRVDWYVDRFMKSRGQK